MSPTSPKTRQELSRLLPAAVGIALLTRLLTLGAYPLTDTTEARYAEVARKMVQLNDWVTPWYDYGMPFWAKPPLSMWMTALSFKVLGVSEIAARLPHLLAGAAVVWLIWDWLRATGVRQSWRAAALMSGSFVFFISAGAVMTDMAMVLGTTLAMRGIWLGMFGDERTRGRETALAFAGIAIGLLAKGPVSLVLVLAAACGWAITTRYAIATLRGLPWVRGAALVGALVIPWYAMAEKATPGFLSYFLVGEHWQRFLVSGWKGDRFGNAHAFPLGSILLFAAVAFLPWTLGLPALLRHGYRQKSLGPPPGGAGGLSTYVGWCALVPILVFLPARNILWTYVLPAAPPLAAWAALKLATHPRGRLVDWVLATGTIAMSLTFVGVVTYRHVTTDWKSAKEVVAAYHTYASKAPALLLFLGTRPYSAAFYSEGQAELLPAERGLGHQEAPVYVAVAASEFYSLDFQLPTGWRLLGRHGRYVLLYRIPANGLMPSAQLRYQPEVDLFLAAASQSPCFDVRTARFTNSLTWHHYRALEPDFKHENWRSSSRGRYCRRNYSVLRTRRAPAAALSHKVELSVL